MHSEEARQHVYKTGDLRPLKAICALGFAFLVLTTLLILLDGPATGYETSVYEAAPVLAWVCMGVSVAIGLGVGVQQSLAEAKRGAWWAVGLTILLGNNLVFLLLPVLRGYALHGREDAMTHVGYAVDVLRTGFLSDKDVYPVQHVFVAVFSMISGLPPMLTTQLLTPLVSIAYVGFVFCLAQFVLNDTRSVRLATLSSTVLLFSPMQYHSWLSPSGIGVILVPLVIYIFLKNITTSSVALSISAVLIVGIVLPFVHPLNWVVTLSTLVTIGLASAFLIQKEPIWSALRKARLGAVEISAVVFLAWFLSFYLAEHLIRIAYARFFGPGLDFVMMDRVLQSADRVGYQLLDVVILIAKTCGHDIIYIALCAIAVAAAVYRLLGRQDDKEARTLLTLAPAVVCPTLFFLIHMFATVVEFGIMRLVTTMVASTPLFVGYALSGLDRLLRAKCGTGPGVAAVLSSTLIGSIIISCWLLGFGSTYGWLFTKQPHQQVTSFETAGVIWLAEHKDPKVSADLNRMVSRFTDGLFGTKWREEKGIYRVADTTSPIGALPSHFARPTHLRLGEWFEQDIYVALSAYDIAFHEVFFPEFNQFDQSDFDALYLDTSAAKVFSDGEFEVWYVRSVSGQD